MLFAMTHLTGTLGVGTLAGQVQVAQQVGGQLVRVVGNVTALDGAAGQLQQRGRVVGHLLDEAHHQRVAAQAELLQVHQAEDLPRQVSQQVVVETQRPQRVEPVTGQREERQGHRREPSRRVQKAAWLPGELRRDALDAVVAQDQVAERGQVSHLRRDGRDEVPAQIQQLQTTRKQTGRRTM